MTEISHGDILVLDDEHAKTSAQKSASGIYHVMLRGINQQQIFEDSEDCDKFIQILKECKAVSEFKLFAYCLTIRGRFSVMNEGNLQRAHKEPSPVRLKVFIAIIHSTEGI